MTPLRSFLTASFRKLYADLPNGVQKLHPSIEFQAKGKLWTVAIGRSYRAIARRFGNDVHWVWIGSHEDYNNVLRRLR